MSIKELLITGWQQKAYPYRNVRPVWQIIIYTPLFLIYLPAKHFVDWMDGL